MLPQGSVAEDSLSLLRLTRIITPVFVNRRLGHLFRNVEHNHAAQLLDT
jgi:hypothetical protein